MISTPVARPVSVRLDWRAYFREFSALHGGDPVIYKGRLLFADGWTYSASDYQGPEWPPPDDPKALANLQRWYWGRRRTIVRHELFTLRESLLSLETAQRNRSAPLQQIVTVKVWNEGLGRDANVWQAKNVDLEGMRGRLAWLEEDLGRCSECLNGVL